MLPDGMRYASTKNVRSTRKIAIVPVIDLIHSHTCLYVKPPPDLPPRAAATLFLGLPDDFLPATIWTPCCFGAVKAERAHPLELKLDAPSPLSPHQSNKVS